MCCALLSFALIGPRVGIIVWWLFDPGRFSAVFDTIFFPLIGIIFAPWTTAAYLLVARNGVEGIDWLWIIIAILLDLSSYGGGILSRKRNN